ncbi:putative NBD/HSP70 family sugar kinase [Kitasatospora sp. MAP12-15]|uniref:ROK family transcriptional regulator n=1 Tax=unclassified Kitasatospora TaxID=2633591 RepID=UPI0024731B9F|nr:ROK family transcriptional regulator [Kitasatospora sp. MAP12-44]MDH6108727.1 putative NBD/HSP70 family sugar kinase [Kitasatospora sp. MAP12-44]
MPLALIATPVPQAGPEQPDGAAAVLRAALHRGPLARSAISRETGLSPASVSRHAAELLALGLVHEPPPPARQPPRPGRPRVPLDIDTAHHLAAGVHIAAPRLTFSLTDLRGRVVAQEQGPRQAEAPDVLRDIARHLPGFLARHATGRSVLGLGVVTGGWVDPDAGTLVENAALGWRDVPLRAVLARRIRLPIHIDSHARALARAETLFGAARHGDLVHLFVGNVVDAAIAAGGSLLRGRRNRAGGIAHLPVPGSRQVCPCGRTGCLQATVSDRTLAERAARGRIIPRPELGLLLDAARGGDADALELCRERLRLLAHAVGLLLDMIGPDVLVLTEAVTTYLPELLAELHHELGPGAEQVVLAGSFGTQALAVAAGAPVLASVHQDPLALRTSGSYFHTVTNHCPPGHITAG